MSHIPPSTHANMSERLSIQNTFGKISDGLLEGMGCVLISTIQGAKHLVVAIKGQPTHQESIAEWQLVHRIEQGELFDGKDSHTVWIMD